MAISKIKSSQIFRWLWRINGILILLVGIGICGVLIVAAFSAMKERFRTNNRDSVRVNTPIGAIVKLQLNYGAFTKIEGTNYLMSPLRSEQEYTNFGYGSMKEQSNIAIRNYFFFNIADQSTHWVLPHNEFLFVNCEKISRENKKVKYEDEGLPVAAIYYEIIKADSNGDGKINKGDKLTIAFSDATGANFIELIQNIDEILGKERLNDDVLLIFYKSEGKSLIAQVSVSNRKLIATTELPKIQ